MSRHTIIKCDRCGLAKEHTRETEVIIRDVNYEDEMNVVYTGDICPTCERGLEKAINKYLTKPRAKSPKLILHGVR